MMTYLTTGKMIDFKIDQLLVLKFIHNVKLHANVFFGGLKSTFDTVRNSVRQTKEQTIVHIESSIIQQMNFD